MDTQTEDLELFVQGILKPSTFKYRLLETRYWESRIGAPLPLQTERWNTMTFYAGVGMERPDDL
jgi:hypothetical protein